MKKIFFILIMFMSVINLSAQEFVAPTKSHTTFTDTVTTYTYKCPERTYKVYKSKSGAFYIWKVSKKTGKEYKYYLPKDIQIKMGRKYKDEVK